MRNPVVAIGIDGPNTRMLQAWLDQGSLPRLSQLAREGSIAGYTHEKRFRNERCWDTLLFGADSGSAGSVFVPQHYRYFNESLQRQDHFQPFFALGNRFKVCMFDLPATLSNEVNGIQLTGWGMELNASMPAAVPADLMAEIVAKYGADPKLVDSQRVIDQPTGESERSFVLPSLYDAAALLAFKDALLTSVERRTAICLDLLERDDWDLFIALYPENHTANHMLWHLAEDHPVGAVAKCRVNPLLEICQAVDRGIGRILDQLDRKAQVVVFTLDHTVANSMDVPSMALLPELLFRWNHPGSQALADGDRSLPVPAMRTDYRQHWKHEVWALRTAVGDKVLESPQALEEAGDALSWNPANWYRLLWPQMRAFALPSVSDGHVRLNVKGREGQGLVEPGAFVATLDAVCSQLRSLTNPRTGKALVRSILQTRSDPFEHPAVPPDLIVCWDDSMPADVLDSPEFGRIGPLPFFRSGGHVAHGSQIENMLIARSPALAPGQTLISGTLEDVPASILDLLGASLPTHFTGRSLFHSLDR